MHDQISSIDAGRSTPPLRVQRRGWWGTRHDGETRRVRGWDRSR